MVHGNITDWETKFNEVPFETYSGTKQMRYYQKNAVNNVLKAIANGDQRLLLTLATGTGKTFIAFQIARRRELESNGLRVWPRQRMAEWLQLEPRQVFDERMQPGGPRPSLFE